MSNSIGISLTVKSDKPIDPNSAKHIEDGLNHWLKRLDESKRIEDMIKNKQLYDVVHAYTIQCEVVCEEYKRVIGLITPGLGTSGGL